MTTVAERVRRAADPWVPEGTTRGQVVSVAALVLIAAQLAFRAWAVYGGWFYGDDLQWLATSARGGADLGWVFSPHDSQLMPLGLSLAAWVGAAGPWAWGLAATQIVVLQAAACLACWWALRTLFGDRPEILLPLVTYLTATATLPALLWWAVALNQLPLHVAMFVALGAHVRWLRERRTRWLALAAGALVLGYASYVKTLLVIPVLVAVTLCWFVTGGPWHRVRTSLVEHRAAWAVYGSLTAGYLVLYRLVVPSPLDTDGTVDYLGLADTLFRRSLGPMLVGGPWRWDDLNPPVLTTDTPEALTSLAWVLVVVAAGYLLLTRRRSARVALVVVPYLALTWYLVAEGRAWALGDFAGLEPRYLADVFALVPLVAGLAWLPVVGAPEPVERKSGLPRLPARAAWIAATCSLLVVSSTTSALTYVAAWHADYPTRAFVQTASASVSGADEPPVLSDEPVSPEWLGGQLFPHNKPSYFLSPVDGRFSTSTAANDLEVLDRTGRLAVPSVTDGITADLRRTHPCGLLVKGGDTARVPLGARTIDVDFWLVTGYLAGRPGTVEVRTGSSVREAPVAPGAHRLFVRTTGEFDTVTLTPSAGTDMCLDSLAVGTLTPEG